MDFSKVKGFLIDLDGTIYVEDKAVQGALEVVYKLKEKYPVRFVSNTTSKPLDVVIKQLSDLGFQIEKEEVFTALEAIKKFLKTQKKNAFLLLSDLAKEELKEFDKEPYDCVVVAHARKNFTYESINTAFRYLMKGAQLISSSKTRYYLEKDGGLSLDGGAFTHLLEFASSKEALILGKPSKKFFLDAVSDMGLESSEVVMIGDDIANDVHGAQEAGLSGFLVKTGKYLESDLDKGFKPDAVLDSLASLKKMFSL